MAAKIIYKQYTMELAEHCEDKFDLYRTVKRQSKENGKLTGETKEGEELIGYGINLPNCIKKIAHLSVLKEDRVLELKQFIAEYKEAIQEIESFITA